MTRSISNKTSSSTVGYSGSFLPISCSIRWYNSTSYLQKNKELLVSYEIQLYFVTSLQLRNTIDSNRVHYLSVVKPNPKLSPQQIRTDVSNAMNQSELETSTCNRRQARENACERGTIGYYYCFPLVERVARVLLTNDRVQVKQNQSKRQITLNSTLK